MSGETNEALLREALVGLAKLSERLEAVDQRVEGVTRDAREARDAAREVVSASRVQDIPAKIAELKGMIDQISSAARADLVNASSKITTELREKHQDHEGRISSLEAERQRRDGAAGLIGWVTKHAPWLLPAVAFLAGFAVTKGNPHG